MNAAKRVSNQTIKKKENKEKEPVVQSSGNGRYIVFGVLALVLVLVIGMVCWENLHPRLILTVNDEKVYLEDMMVDIYTYEQNGAYLDSIYQQSNGTSYWNAEAENGMTYGEVLKDSVLEAVSQRKMMYREALDAGYQLTEEENKTVEEDAEKMYSGLTTDVKKNTGLTKNKILDYYKIKTLADRYKSDWIDTFAIDDAQIIADKGITPEDYRQYDIQYYYIPYTREEANTTVDMTDEERVNAFNELQNSYADIAGLEDFSTYIDNSQDTAEENAEATATPEVTTPKAPEGTNIKYTSKSFIENDAAEDLGFDAMLLMQIKAMANGQITDGVLQDSHGCYIIKMVENNSTERYDSECATAISEKEQEEFQTQIDNLEVDKYVIEINDEEWDKVKFGSITVNN